ncbi:GntR family transcriptional regulator [Priestia megaterium]|uniref:GntR family transcriptional regulator n=1 Tax=Priestia megaterium TaxID=1404 RepID=UPI00366FEB55
MANQSLKEEVRRVIREDIISNKLQPGQRIVETKIAKDMGISQVPVREALRGLEEEGLVKSIKYRGSIVTEINVSEMYHIFLLRSKIEESAISLLLPNLTKRDIGELYDIVDKMALISKTEDYSVQSALDLEFHYTIVKWSNIDTFVRMWSILNGHIRRFITFIHPMIKNKQTEVFNDHLNLVKVLESRDVEKAKIAFKNHILEFFVKNEELISKIFQEK